MTINECKAIWDAMIMTDAEKRELARDAYCEASDLFERLNDDPQNVLHALTVHCVRAFTFMQNERKAGRGENMVACLTIMTRCVLSRHSPRLASVTVFPTTCA